MHTYTKRVTFTPLKKGRYRCNQTGETLTQREILAYVSRFIGGGGGIIGRSNQKSSPPKKKAGGTSHPSGYRAKQKR